MEGRLREEVEVGGQGLIQLIVVRELCVGVCWRERKRERIAVRSHAWYSLPQGS